MARFVIAGVAALALVIPLLLGWRGIGWRGFGVLLLTCALMAAIPAVWIYRADQDCLADPGCGSWSGILWTLLGAVALGYPLLAAALVGLGAWARRRGGARAAGPAHHPP